MNGRDWELPPPVVPIRSSPVGGRLGLFWENWAILEDPYVTNVLHHGYRLPIAETPPLTSAPQPRVYSSHQHQLLRENIDILLEKRAVRVVHNPLHAPGFYSPIFLVPKKGSTKMRMIHNMAYFNEHYLLDPPHFRMVTLDLLRAKISPNESMVSLDIQDAYLHVPIHPQHWRYLRFVFDGVHYEWTVLPFGISWAPWLFTRLTKPIVRFLHLRGINFEPYIDDCLLHHLATALLRRQLQFARSLMSQLGWLLNLEKSHLVPTHSLIFIGGHFLTDQNLLRVPQDRWEKILAAAQKALSQPLKLRDWQSLLGLLTSAQSLTARGRLQVRPLQRFLAPFIQEDDTRSLIRVPQHLRQHLEWWTQPSNVCVGVCLREPAVDLEMFVDASRQGWGAHLLNQTTSGLWEPLHQEWHINSLEMEAVILAISHWAPQLQGKRLLVASDNATVVWTIRNQGTTKSLHLLEQAFTLFRLADELEAQIVARHIPGCRNVLADALSRPGRPSPTEWMLHKEAFGLLCHHWSRPNIDLFATRLNNQIPTYVSPIPDPAAWAVDALSLDWDGLYAYAFPPPVLLQQVLSKVRASRSLRMLLVAPYWPARLWFPDLLDLAEGDPFPLPAWPNLLVHSVTKQPHQDPDKFALHGWMLCSPLSEPRATPVQQPLL